MSRATLIQFIRYGTSCAIALGAKLGVMWLCLKLFNPFLSYLLVQVFIFFFSYAMHIKVSFKDSKHSSKTLLKYFHTVIGFKILDYIVFSGIFVYFEIDALLAVFITSLAILCIRFVAVRNALMG